MSWHTRRIDNLEGVAEGTVTTKTGGVQPVSVRLVQESGRWKVAGVNYRGIEFTTGPPSVPPQEGLQSLATDALLAVNGAVRVEDFTDFHRTRADV